MYFKDLIKIIESKSLVKGITSTYSKEEMMSKLCFPIDYEMLDNLGFVYEREVYHLTNYKYFDKLLNSQGKYNIQLSTFTKSDNKLMKLPSKPNILLKLKGEQLLESKSDMFTLVDKDSQRWIILNDDKLKFYIQGLLQSIIPELPNKYNEKVYLDIIKSYNKDVYRVFIEKLEDWLNKNYKLLNKYLKTNGTTKYNEVILTNYKIIETWSLDDRFKNELGDFNYKGKITINLKDTINDLSS